MHSDSDCSGDESFTGYEFCARRRPSAVGLPFDPSSIEKIILTIGDKFNFQVMMDINRVKGAMVVTTGLAIAGGLIGRAYGGNMGATLGGAFGGACGLGLVAMSMRDVWNDIKPKLSEIFDIVYDFLAGMGIDDYTKAAMLLTSNSSAGITLAKIILETSTDILGKRVLSSLNTP